MSETERASGDSREALERTVREEMLPLAELLEETFARAARTIEEELAAAAKSGSLSFKAMTEEILNDLARLAAEEFIRQPIENALLRALGGGRTGGAGASSAGRKPSETQIAASLAQILGRAGRNG